MTALLESIDQMSIDFKHQLSLSPWCCPEAKLSRKRTQNINLKSICLLHLLVDAYDQSALSNHNTPMEALSTAFKLCWVID